MVESTSVLQTYSINPFDSERTDQNKKQSERYSLNERQASRIEQEEGKEFARSVTQGSGVQRTLTQTQFESERTVGNLDDSARVSRLSKDAIYMEDAMSGTIEPAEVVSEKAR